MGGLIEQINENRAKQGLNARPTGKTGKGRAPREKLNYANMAKTTSRVQENDRLIDAWCEENGLNRKDYTVPEKLKFIPLAKAAGL